MLNAEQVDGRAPGRMLLADQLAVRLLYRLALGAASRAWNLWGRASDRDFASELATDIKTYLVDTDEGIAFAAVD
jgi:hypothetical protein